MRALAAGLATTLLAACANDAAEPAAAGFGPDPCAEIGGGPAVAATLVFPLDVPGGGGVGPEEWSAFLRDTIAPRFPEELTVLDGTGQWRDHATGQVNAGRYRVVLLAVLPNPVALHALTEIAALYKARFHQKSVGIIASPACSVF